MRVHASVLAPEEVTLSSLMMVGTWHCDAPMCPQGPGRLKALDFLEMTVPVAAGCKRTYNDPLRL